MTGIIILAAGQSARMGTAKQHLQYRGKSLLENAVLAATASDAGSVVVVLGYEPGKIELLASDVRVSITVNEDWQEGMGSSISKGIRQLLDVQPLIDQAVIMLCDQPLVTGDLLNQLINAKTSAQRGIAACAYSNTIGVPALFDKVYFNKLISLEGESGAKKILQQFANDVAAIDFPGGVIDIDTPEDFKRLSTDKDIAQ